jgi:threonine synthase
VRFLSTRGGTPPASLGEVLLRGTAPDGGLYVPEALPEGALTSLRPGRSLAETAEAVLRPFFEDDSLLSELPGLCQEAFSFSAPLVPLGEEAFLLELFHGPTSAFKDFGARFLAGCLRRLEPEGVPERTVLVATSGDTGSAVSAAFHRQPGVRVVLLYPEGRVSPRQAHQLGCFGDNVAALRVAGSFDDCQRMVKAAFADSGLASLRLTSANSISLGRLLPQLAYHAHAAFHAPDLSWVVPTGNLGNALAAIWARALGAPIGDIVLASNANRVLPDYFASGNYRARPSVPTLANAMDVGDPSNFERLRWTFPDPRSPGVRLSTESVDDREIENVLRGAERRYARLFCPHTAIAVRALERRQKTGGRWAAVATAHPAKFEAVVEPLVGHAVPVPPSLAALLARPASAEPLTAEDEVFRSWLLAHGTQS